jgi:hypothetical protein
MQHAADVDQLGLVGLDARAMAVAVHLDHHVEGVLFGLALGDHRLRRRQRVHQDGQRASSPAQHQRPVELRRRNADGVEHVGEARVEELLRFLQRRHRDAAGAGGLLPPRDLNAFRRLDVRPQANTERGHALLHAHDIAHHARLVDQRGGGWNVGEMQGRHASRPSSHGMR